MKEMGIALLKDCQFEEFESIEFTEIDMTLIKVLSELRSVYGRDLLCVWSVSYGIIDATDWLLSILKKCGAHAMLSCSTSVKRVIHESSVGNIFIVVTQENECYSFEGVPLSGEELYYIGFRRGMKYIDALTDKTKEDQCKADKTHFYELLQGIKIKDLGCFRNSQIQFVKKVLPRLSEKFNERPTSYSKDIPRRSSLPYQVLSELLEPLGLRAYSSEDIEVSRIDKALTRVGEDAVREKIRNSELISNSLLLGFGFNDLSVNPDGSIGEILYSTRTAYLRS